MAIKKENALLTIYSTQCVDGETDSSELNTIADYLLFPDHVEIIYNELDDAGSINGETIISVMKSGLVSIHKTGFTDSLMIMETGKNHPVHYQTMVGNMEMQLRTLSINASFSKKGGTLRMRYLLDIGINYSAENTIDLRVSLRQTDERAATLGKECCT